MLVARVETIELGSEENVEDTVLGLPQEIVRTKREERDPIFGREVVRDARLVVTVVERHVGRQQREERRGK